MHRVLSKNSDSIEQNLFVVAFLRRIKRSFKVSQVMNTNAVFVTNQKVKKYTYY